MYTVYDNHYTRDARDSWKASGTNHWTGSQLSLTGGFQYTPAVHVAVVACILSHVMGNKYVGIQTIVYDNHSPLTHSRRRSPIPTHAPRCRGLKS
jgi:hypothetical protein